MNVCCAGRYILQSYLALVRSAVFLMEHLRFDLIRNCSVNLIIALVGLHAFALSGKVA